MGLINILLLSVLTGCSDSATELDAVTGFEEAQYDLRFLVKPIQLTEKGLLRTLPSERSVTVGQTDARDIDLQLLRAVSIPLNVQGRINAPAAKAETPSLPSPVSGQIIFTPKVINGQPYEIFSTSVRATIDELGKGTVNLVPGTYRIDVIPDNPQIPCRSFEESLGPDGTPSLSLDLTSDYEIWGQLTDHLGNPLAGTEVYAETFNTESADYLRSQPVLTDSEGWYFIPVYPESDDSLFRAVAAGASGNTNPTIYGTWGDFVVDEVDVFDRRSDVQYPQLEFVDTTITVRDEFGRSVPGTSIVYVSTTVATLDSNQISSTAESLAGSGTTTTNLPAGTYRVTVLPPSGQGLELLTPVDLGVVDIGPNNFRLGTIEIHSSRTFTGTITDFTNATLSGSTISCHEMEFRRRVFSAVADANGQFEVEVSRVPLDCIITGPAGRVDLAIQRFEVQPNESAIQVSLRPGLIVSGTVTLDGQPEAFPTVSIYQVSGDLTVPLTSITADAQGLFSVALP